MLRCWRAVRASNVVQQDATVGDMLSLDLLTDIGDAREWTAIELVWLVDSATEDILKACAFEWSSDGVTWVCGAFGLHVAAS